MRRREFIARLGSAAWPLAARAQLEHTTLLKAPLRVHRWRHREEVDVGRKD
jgi:hypothetical protein